MDKDEQKRRAEVFRLMHQAPPLLVLPNVWDVCSARLLELEGFRSLATTSAGIAATLGYPDGQHMSIEENLEVVRRIAGKVQIPVSADLEAGYSDSTEGVVGAARAVLAVGAAGVNLEDGTGNPESPLLDMSLQAERITAVRETASSAGIPLVINARTDVFLVLREPLDDRLRETVRRATAYREAGADCVFVPDLGDLDRAGIGLLAREIEAPLNVIAGARTPSVPELEELGVARVTFGPRPMRAVLALLRRITLEWKEEGTYQRMLEDSLSYDDVNQMFDARAGERS